MIRPRSPHALRPMPDPLEPLNAVSSLIPSLPTLSGLPSEIRAVPAEHSHPQGVPRSTLYATSPLAGGGVPATRRTAAPSPRSGIAAGTTSTAADLRTAALVGRGGVVDLAAWSPRFGLTVPPAVPSPPAVPIASSSSPRSLTATPAAVAPPAAHAAVTIATPAPSTVAPQGAGAPIASYVATTATTASAPSGPVQDLASPRSQGGNGYKYFRVGAPTDATTSHGLGGLALEGGSTDIDAVYQWMGAHMGGHGDFLVIRAGGTDAYDSYIYDMGGFNSVSTLIIPNRAAANDPFVAATIRNAEAVFIAGGNQADYVDYWTGTSVQDAVDGDLARGVPVGGTSAGLAVLGQFVFSAERGTVSSDQALADPYDSHVTLARDFLSAPTLANTITDSHFVARDRMGRLVTFLARLSADGWSPDGHPRGIGINEKTAVLVEPNGIGTVVDNRDNPPPDNQTSGASYAYFLRAPGLPRVVQPKTPLTYEPIAVQRVEAGGRFDLDRWTVVSGPALTYTLSVESGSLTSDRPPSGSIY